jgi:hypothetical protein
MLEILDKEPGEKNARAKKAISRDHDKKRQ